MLDAFQRGLEPTITLGTDKIKQQSFVALSSVERLLQIGSEARPQPPTVGCGIAVYPVEIIRLRCDYQGTL